MNITFIHYSNKAGLTELDPNFYGSGIGGRDVERVRREKAPLRVYGYVYKGGKLPKKEVGLGVNVYEGEVDNIYDFSSKLINGLIKVYCSGFYPFERGSKTEEFLIKHGYNGYISPSYPNIIAIFKKISVKEVIK